MLVLVLVVFLHLLVLVSALLVLVLVLIPLVISVLLLHLPVPSFLLVQLIQLAQLIPSWLNDMLRCVRKSHDKLSLWWFCGSIRLSTRFKEKNSVSIFKYV